VYLLVAGLIFGLLWFLVNFVGGKIPGPAGQWFVTIAQVILVVLAVLVLIGILLSLVSGQPVFRP
jgi:hypothetical protein